MPTPGNLQSGAAPLFRLKNQKKWKSERKEKGVPKVAIKNIQKGILKDGMNLKEKDNLVELCDGNNGKPTQKGVEIFALELSNHLGKEITGAYYSKDNSATTTHMALGKYKESLIDYAELPGNSPYEILGLEESLRYNRTAFFHTHPGGRDPFQQDYVTRDAYKNLTPKPRFYILRNLKGSPENYTYDKLDYTDW